MRVIYLTNDLAGSIDWRSIAAITRHALASVERGYRSLRSIIGVRKTIPVENMVWDSGGFAAFTHGLRVSVEDTIRVYKALAAREKDLFIILDYIPMYNEDPRTRLLKIRRNLENYIVMRERLGCG